MKTIIRHTRALIPIAVLVLLAVSANDPHRSLARAEDLKPATLSNPATTNGPPLQVVPPAQVNLPPQLAEIARLAQAGVGEDVILGYIEKSPSAYPITADQILYLRDLGLSSRVLTALLVHSPAATGSDESVAPEIAPATTATVQPTPANSPTPAVNNTFYDSLAPYGTWMNMPGYGWCWQPTVAAVNSDWQPYSNDGNWLWSDSGWYWNSGYSWGWAPFHYGRWCRYPSYGWLWCPDNVWGPAWVCWRNWGDYCGWAPLPPGACFTAGIGWTWNGVGVGFNFGFGLPWSCFSFVHDRDFGGRHWFDHRLGGHEARNAFDHSEVANRYHLDPAHGIVNRGVDPKRIEAATHSPLRSVGIRDLPGGASHAGVMPGRLARIGGATVAYRPGANTAVRRDPVLATLNRPRQFDGTLRSASGTGWLNARAENSGAATVRNLSRPVPSFAGRGSQVTPGVTRPAAPTLNGPPPSTSVPTHLWTAPAARSPAVPFRSFNYAPSFRSVPSPSYSRPSTPAWSVARPSYSPPHYSAPSFRSWSTPSRSFAPPSYSGRSFSSPSYRPPSYSSRASTFGGGGSFGISHPAGGGGWGRGVGRQR